MRGERGGVPAQTRLYEVWVGGSVLLVESEHPKRAINTVIREIKRAARASVATSKRSMELSEMGTPYLKVNAQLPVMDLFPGAVVNANLAGLQGAQRLPSTSSERVVP